MRQYLLVLSIVSLWLILQKDDQRSSFHRQPSVKDNKTIQLPPSKSTAKPKPEGMPASIDEPCIINRETLMIMYGLEMNNGKKLSERPHNQLATVIPVNFKNRTS